MRIAFLAAALPACHAFQGTSTEHDGSGDVPGETTLEVELEWPDVQVPDGEVPVIPIVETCGNRTMDPGEECDDGNRLDGDGCDWTCHMGDGGPAPRVDPSAADFIYEGGPIIVAGEGEAAGSAMAWHRLPLVWTGSSYATAFVTSEVDSDLNPICPCSIRFLRLDALGSVLDGGWAYSIPDYSWGLDLAWTGSEFGLFFDVRGNGIYFLGLDPVGKPLGDPVIVEPDPEASMPSIDLLENGYVIAWAMYLFDTDLESDELRMRISDLHGRTEGLPGPVSLGESEAILEPVDVTAGENGFGLIVLSWEEDDYFGTSSTRFLHVSQDLTSARGSGVLSDGLGGDVLWLDGFYAAAWTHWNTTPMDTSPVDVCVARFDPAGEMERAPICTWVQDSDGGHGYPGTARMSAAERGLGIVWSWGSDSRSAYPLFMRTDLLGVPVSEPQSMWSMVRAGFFISVAIAWTGEEYGMLLGSQPDNLWFQRIREI